MSNLIKQIELKSSYVMLLTGYSASKIFISLNLQKKFFQEIEDLYGPLIYSPNLGLKDCDFRYKNLKGFWIERHKDILEVC